MKKLLLTIVALSFINCGIWIEDDIIFYETYQGTEVWLYDGLNYPVKQEMEYALSFFAQKYPEVYDDFFVVNAYNTFRLLRHVQIEWHRN
jgi:hypothetical protein